MRLNLKQVLAMAGLQKHTFDARRRQDLHSFLHESLSSNPDVAEYENARNKWGIEHVVALRCIQWGVEKCDLTVKAADSIIAINFGDLAAAIEDGSIEPDEHLAIRGGLRHFLIGRVSFGIGREHFAGTMSDLEGKLIKWSAKFDSHPGEMLAGIVLIDASAVYQEVKMILVGEPAE